MAKSWISCVGLSLHSAGCARHNRSETIKAEMISIHTRELQPMLAGASFFLLSCTLHQSFYLTCGFQVSASEAKTDHGLTANAKTITLQKEKVGENLHCLKVGKEFLWQFLCKLLPKLFKLTSVYLIRHPVLQKPPQMK